MEPSDALRTLRTFRYSLYECLHRRADALFELTDAILTADAVPSAAHLSLEAPHRRGWGSLYAALDRGRINAETLRGLLACNPFAGGKDKLGLTRLREPIRVKRSGSVKGVEEDGQDRQTIFA
jgi:hypothetical protein